MAQQNDLLRVEWMESFRHQQFLPFHIHQPKVNCRHRTSLPTAQIAFDEYSYHFSILSMSRWLPERQSPIIARPDDRRFGFVHFSLVDDSIVRHLGREHDGTLGVSIWLDTQIFSISHLSYNLHVCVRRTSDIVCVQMKKNMVEPCWLDISWFPSYRNVPSQVLHDYHSCISGTGMEHETTNRLW